MFKIKYNWLALYICNCKCNYILRDIKTQQIFICKIDHFFTYLSSRLHNEGGYWIRGMGKMGRMGQMGRMGRMGRMGQIGRIGKIGKIRRGYHNPILPIFPIYPINFTSISKRNFLLEGVRLGLSQKKSPRDSTQTYSPRGLTLCDGPRMTPYHMK